MAEDVNVENRQNFFYEAGVEMQYIKLLINCAEGYLTLQLIIRTVATVWLFFDVASFDARCRFTRSESKTNGAISPERRDSKC